MVEKHVTCSVPDCSGNSHWKKGGSEGMCYKHHYRMQKYGSPTGGRTFVGAPKDFLDSFLVKSHSVSECIFWPYAKNSAGYGHLIIDGKHKLVSRIVCEKYNGPQPEGKTSAAHSCGNGHLGCMNPNHLRWATPAENSKDMDSHGTRLNGELLSWSVLTEQIVFEILISEAPSRMWSSLLGVNYGTITAVRRRETWRHVHV